MSILSKKPSKTQQKQSNYIQQPIRTVDGEIRIKKYAKIKIVGSGSYSKCYLVKNTDSDSTYVAKIIPKKKLQILQKQKLIYQIKIHQSLSHHNIVHLDHWFEDENNQYIFMQYCPNGNLQTRLSQVENMPQKDISRFGYQIVNAIMYIHSQNILHRDLKLCNFYLDANDNVKLGDFGFACQLASEYDRKRETCGTPNYIAPQAISGFGYSYSSDVWAIGVILYRLRYGVCPFEGQSVKKTLENVKVCNFRFPSKPKIGAQLRDLIQKIFNLNYDQRLTTQEILEHKFFEDQCNQPSPVKKQLQEQKRGFSLSRLFSRDKSKNDDKKKDSKKQSDNARQNDPGSRGTGRQGILQRQSRNPSTHTKKQQPKRSNSCQTFKQIKQIFKNKSKQNLITSAQTQSNITKRDLGPSPYYTLSTLTSSNRDKDQSSKTNRNSIAQYSYAYSVNLNITQGNSNLNSVNKKQQPTNNRSNRLNQFIKSQVNSISLKQQLKMNKGNMSKNTSSNNITNTTNTNTNANTNNTQVCTNIQKSQQNLQQTKDIPIPISNAYYFKNQLNIKQPNTTTTTTTTNTLKISKNSLITPSQQQLSHYSRRYYLPLLIQQQKDVIIIHYKPSVKHIIYSNIGYIVHRNISTVYKMSGEMIEIADLPKVFKYILENKVDVKEYEQEEDYQYGENTIPKILQNVPQNWILLKDGIILKYSGYTNLTVSKLFAQEGFYVNDDHGQALMYNVGSDHVPKLFEGIVIMRIYSGWVKTHYKK